MSTIGLGIILKNAAMLIWGTNQISFPSPFGEGVIRFMGAGIYPQEIFVIACCMLLMLGLELFQKKTTVGKALLAISFNNEWASLMGINVNFMIVMSFVASSAMAALAGVIVAPITSAWVLMGSLLGLKAFCAAIPGGLESPRACFAGGIILGIFEFLVASWRSELKELSVFVLIIIVLAIRPKGLFTPPAAEKV